MYEVLFLWVLGLVWITFAIFQDFKTREIANWLNFSLAIFSLGFRFFYSLFNHDGFLFFYQGLAGLGVFFLISNLFYYSKIFAGGDAKLMISLGAILPLGKPFSYNLINFLYFILLFLLIGAVYTLFISFFLCIKNFDKFKLEFLKQFNLNKKWFVLIFISSLIFLLLSLIQTFFILISFFIFFCFFIYLYSISIDEICMVKEVSPNKLMEGDWLYSNVKIGNQTIKAKWDGLNQNEIRKLIKFGKKVKIRQGIPFSPTFLISFLIFIGIILFKIRLWNPFW